jgi:hypothetical protein
MDGFSYYVQSKLVIRDRDIGDKMFYLEILSPGAKGTKRFLRGIGTHGTYSRV